MNKYSTTKFIIVIAFLFATNNTLLSWQSGQDHDRVNFQGEEQIIALGEFFKSPKEAIAEKKEFYRRFRSRRFRNTKVQMRKDTSFKMHAFLELYNTSKAVAQQIYGQGSEEYITGVRIIPGLNQSNSTDTLVLYFEPMFISVDTLNTTAKTVIGKVEHLSATEIYEYDGRLQRFDKTNREDAYESHKRYKQFIEMRRFRNGRRFQNHELREDWKGDVRHIIFSFQELFALYHTNFDVGLSRLKYDEVITIHNGSYYLKKRGSRRRYKHVFLFSPGDLPLEQLEVSITPIEIGDSANLAHMCPPSCGEIVYPIEN